MMDSGECDDERLIVPLKSPISLPSVDGCNYGHFGRYNRFWSLRVDPLPDTIFGLRYVNMSRGLLHRLSKVKQLIFGNFSDRAIKNARRQCNIFECIGSSIFMNRAAMKLAEIDSVFDFALSRTQPIPEMLFASIPVEDRVLYFADICGGPGGFTEYMLWRRPYTCKGFGITLKNKTDDFKLDELNTEAYGSHCFDVHYGLDGTGDIYRLENIKAFARNVRNKTNNNGVHTALADGGFCVEGKEDFQEIMSKRLYVAQCLCALYVLQSGGDFMCKIFDHYTEFSIGILFLLRAVFRNVYIYKPACSRPANAERYVICRELRISTKLNLEAELEILSKFGTGIFDKNRSLCTEDKCFIRVIDQLSLTLKECEKIDCSSSYDLRAIIPRRYLQQSHHFTTCVVGAISRLAHLQLDSLEMLFRTLKGTETNMVTDIVKNCNRVHYLRQWNIPCRKREYKTTRFSSLNPSRSLAQMAGILTSEDTSFISHLRIDRFDACNYSCVPLFSEAAATGRQLALLSSDNKNTGIMYLADGKSRRKRLNNIHFVKNSILMVEKVVTVHETNNKVFYVAIDLLCLNGMPMNYSTHIVRHNILANVLTTLNAPSDNPILISHRFDNSHEIWKTHQHSMNWKPPYVNAYRYSISPSTPHIFSTVKCYFCPYAKNDRIFSINCSSSGAQHKVTGFQEDHLSPECKVDFVRCDLEPIEQNEIWTYVNRDASDYFICQSLKIDGTKKISQVKPPVFLKSIMSKDTLDGDFSSLISPEIQPSITPNLSDSTISTPQTEDSNEEFNPFNFTEKMSTEIDAQCI